MVNLRIVGAKPFQQGFVPSQESADRQVTLAPDEGHLPRSAMGELGYSSVSWRSRAFRRSWKRGQI